MAVILPSSASDQHFSISNIISKFRLKKRAGRKQSREQIQQQDVVQDTRPSLIAAPLPLVLPEHQQTLSNLGWTTVTFPQPISEGSSLGGVMSEAHYPSPGPHPLQQAYEALFAASQAFFNQTNEEKARWKHKLGSEEGWSKIPGEKEFITLRTLEYCPEVLRDPAERYWNLLGSHLSSTLGQISTSLGLPNGEQEGLRRFVGPCAIMQATDATKTATMLRLFRYEGWDAKIVAEPHADLGLLSVVVGNVPGLEVWDGMTWFGVESEVEKAGKKGASMLAGRQLERLSNGRYPAGGHRVVSYGLPRQDLATDTPENTSGKKRYRFSIVFVLRAHEPTIINSNELETEVTGKWIKPLQDVTAGKFYEEIRGKHYNINIDVKEREKQRRKVKSGKS
ncbi:Nn.00g103120.m01.CDS01 [Neocucurbitaria sp. VM-36]